MKTDCSKDQAVDSSFRTGIGERINRNALIKLGDAEGLSPYYAVFYNSTAKPPALPGRMAKAML
jgi:hypothetical protein